MFIDVHSHHSGRSGQLTFIAGIHSIGLHPWDLKRSKTVEELKVEFEHLKSLTDSSLMAVGECGLDRAKSDLYPIDIQKRFLIKHIEWSRQLHVPLVIHCVRAHSDLLQVLKEQKVIGRILMHDFSGNAREAAELLKYDAYFSFGKRLLKQQKTNEVIKTLPLEKLFFETDDESEMNVEILYQKAADLLGIDISTLEEKIEKNLYELFSDLNYMGSSDIINNLR